MMIRNQNRARIAPLEPPFEPDTAERLAGMMPPGVEPIALFRTFARHPVMTDAMSGWGRYVLGRSSSITLRDREIVIDRVCVRCGCEYEWGVHVAYFAERAGLTAEQVASLVSGGAADACWSDPRDRCLVELVDTLHDPGDVTDELWERLGTHFDDVQLLDLLLLAGWYHAISYVARVARTPLEPWAPRFADVR